MDGNKSKPGKTSCRLVEIVALKNNKETKKC